MIICKESSKLSPAVQGATVLKLTGLTMDDVVEYMSKVLGVPDTGFPPALQSFVYKVTLGNPLYIRETLDQLQESVDIQVTKTAGRLPKMECKDLDRVDIAAWEHTAM